MAAVCALQPIPNPGAAIHGDLFSVALRPEREDDWQAIRDVVRAAFQETPYAAGNEAELIDALRREGALSVSLVAERDHMILGQIAFSPAESSDGTVGWAALGPVAVLPAHQRLGVGSQLVRSGLSAILELGAVGCVLTGNPRYYTRFGFRVEASNAPPGEPPEFFMVNPFGGVQPIGPIHFHRAFHSAA